MSDDGLYDYDVDVDDEEMDYYDLDAENSSDEDVSKIFNILSGHDVRCRVDEHILEITSVLSVSRAAAVVLLCNYAWNVTNVHEEWFSDEGKTRNTCGLMMESVSVDDSGAKGNPKGEFFCGICLENYYHNAVDHRPVMASCGHFFCETCWRTYVSTGIQEGPGCLFLRCPQPKCRASICDLIGSLASDEDRVKHENYVLRSYVECRMKNIKWCPAPGCEFAVECLFRDNSSCNYSDFEVTCNCLNRFCWICTNQAHSPSDCETVEKWLLKNSSEGENTNWIISNTKPCPKCGCSIEKNQGCMHMTCRPPCSFHFCWLCLGPWSKHGGETGGFYACNRYEKAKKNGEFETADKIREMAKFSVQRFAHYFERWMGNNVSRRKALEDIEELPTKHFVKLSEIYAVTDAQLKVITDAWVQIVECRRFLKWSYVYGYYLPDNEPGKKELFEYFQGQAESKLEGLHGFVEKELPKYSNSKRNEEEDYPSAKEFYSFCAKVVDLTKITRNYFDNLVRALSNGPSEVEER